MNKRFIITIDGPAGAGKTTLSKALSEKLNYKYIDTGALYRGIALESKKRGINIDNPDELINLCSGLDIKFIQVNKSLRLILNGDDITEIIRTPEISMLASEISAKPVIREFLLKIQREMAKEKGVIFEGRDMGTVVFPNADVKFYLDASANKRAERRYEEIKLKNCQNYEGVLNDIIKRDENDKSRTHSPLKPANDAVLIDSTSKSIDDVIALMLSYINTLL
ncbi:MAG: (d)CMP kinase [Desulfobacterales bacterium]|nr:(d)CMP kinase [Desulfobacterales bacterium]